MEDSLTGGEDRLSTIQVISSVNKLQVVEENVCLEENLELLELNDSKIDPTFRFESDQNISLTNSSQRSASSNRRYSLRPQRKVATTDCDKFTSAVKKKQTSFPKSGSLETIFENPVLKNGTMMLLGKSKLKRYLSFDSFVTKAKTRQRKLKVKRLLKMKVNKTNKITLEDVKLKLKTLDDPNEGDKWMDITE